MHRQPHQHMRTGVISKEQCIDVRCKTDSCRVRCQIGISELKQIVANFDSSAAEVPLNDIRAGLIEILKRDFLPSIELEFAEQLPLERLTQLEKLIELTKKAIISPLSAENLKEFQVLYDDFSGKPSKSVLLPFAIKMIIDYLSLAGIAALIFFAPLPGSFVLGVVGLAMMAGCFSFIATMGYIEDRFLASDSDKYNELTIQRIKSGQLIVKEEPPEYIGFFGGTYGIWKELRRAKLGEFPTYPAGKNICHTFFTAVNAAQKLVVENPGNKPKL